MPTTTKPELAACMRCRLLQQRSPPPTNHACSLSSSMHGHGPFTSRTPGRSHAPCSRLRRCSQYRGWVQVAVAEYTVHDPRFQGMPEALAALQHSMVQYQLDLLKRCRWSVLLDAGRDLRPALQALVRQPSFQPLCAHIEEQAQRWVGWDVVRAMVRLVKAELCLHANCFFRIPCTSSRPPSRALLPAGPSALEPASAPWRSARPPSWRLHPSAATASGAAATAAQGWMGLTGPCLQRLRCPAPRARWCRRRACHTVSGERGGSDLTYTLLTRAELCAIFTQSILITGAHIS